MNNRTTIMVVLLAIAMMTIPSASAVVTEFDVTPTTTTAGVTSAYIMQINTTGFNSLNITIPAGLEAVIPAAGDLVARVDLWNGTELLNVTFTANSTPSEKVDVLAYDWSGDPMGPFVKSVNYSAGEVTGMSKGPYMANLTLPTAEANGTLKLSVREDAIITNMTVMLNLVENPTTAGIYTFGTDDGMSSDVTITDIPVVSIGSANCSVGGTVNVPINITNASNIGAMDISVTYNASILNATGVANGSMIQGVDDLIWDYNISSEEEARMNFSFASYPNMINGTGELFVVTFAADAAGNSPLDINVTEASTGDVSPKPVPVAMVDGYVNVTGAAYPKGDLDHNGQAADAVDVAMMLQGSVGDLTTNSEFDLDGNGDEADAVDVAMMLQASVGDITL